jgi:hypothetical protein
LMKTNPAGAIDRQQLGAASNAETEKA